MDFLFTTKEHKGFTQRNTKAQKIILFQAGVVGYFMILLFKFPTDC